MAFCRAFLAIYIFTQVLFANGVPQTIQYQGRFLDAATNRPVAGVVTKQIVFNIRRVEAGDVPGQIIDTYTASNVSVRDGVFNVEIPISNNVNFDEPYGIEVIVQGSGGGNVGFQPFRSVPYAITAKNALFLGGLSADQYALTTHIHTTAGQKSFTIDGTGGNLLSDDAQFTIKNDQSQEVFRVSASGDLQRVNKIIASGAIETEGSFRVVNQQQEDVFVADQSGHVLVRGDLTISGDSTVGSLEVSGDAQLKQVLITESLTLGPNAIINATPGEGIPNIIGQSHLMEDHASSVLFNRLISLTDGSVLTSSFHSHSFEDAELTSNAIADDAILSIHIKDGEITNDDIAANAAIDDSKLATISTAGKVTTQALPTEVALRNSNNTFGAGFDPANISFLRTKNEFDSVRSKTFNVISTSSGFSDFVEIKDFNAQFRWLLNGRGDLRFKSVGSSGETTRIEIKTDGDKTYIILNDVIFAGDEGMISGDVIANGGIQTADLANGAVTTDKIADSSVITSKIKDGAVTTEKIADGAVTTSKIGVNQITTNEIADGAITSDKIQDGTITSDQIKDGTITGAKLVDGTITSDEIEDATITTAKIAAGAIDTDNIQNEALTNAKIADGAISNLNLNNDVLVARVQPMSITLSNETSPHITLQASNSNAKFVNMVINNANTTPVPGVLISNLSNNHSVSMNLDGSISMKSTNFTTAVTIEPEVMAVMMGLPELGNVCPLNSNYSLINPFDTAQNPIYNGNGFCFRKEIIPANEKNYGNALDQCHQEGAKLCSLNEIYHACEVDAKNNVNSFDGVSIMSVDLTFNTTVSYITFTKNGSCSTPSFNDEDTTVSSGFACCINP